MRLSIILAHPHKGSFNHAIADTVAEALRQNGHNVILHDLYVEGFDPILPFEEISRDAHLDPVVKMHCDEILIADGIIIVHPNWWGQPPAILKGWVDRVIRPGAAYEFEKGDTGEGVPQGLLKAHTAIVFNTSNTPEERERKIFGDPLELLWKNCIFGFCGVNNFYRKIYRIIVTSTKEERGIWLADVQQIINEYFPHSAGKS